MPPLSAITLKLTGGIKAQLEAATNYQKHFQQAAAHPPKPRLTGLYTDYKNICAANKQKEFPAATASLQAAEKNTSEQSLDAAANALKKQKDPLTKNPAAKKFTTDLDQMIQAIYKLM